RVLWDKQAMQAALAGQRPSPPERVGLVVIGGGMSGLTTAYLLRKHKPIVLEQAARLGGNAKGQSWRGIDYSIGAAYLDSPRPGSPMESYFRDLGLENLLVKRSTPDPVEVRGKLYAKFWDGQSEPRQAKKYTKLNAFLHAVSAERE